MKALRAFHQWMFGYGSPVTMGLFRLLFGGITFLTLVMTMIDWKAWYTETGYIPSAILERWNGDIFRFNLLSGVTNPTVTFVFYLLVVVAAFFTTVGLWTRVSSIVLLLGVTSLHHRAPDILHSGDTLIRAMLLYIAVAPSGAAVSLDRYFALKRGVAPEEPREVSLWPQRMMQIQVAILYFTTVWHKSFGEWWLNGTATWYPINLTEFNRFPVPEFLDKQPFLALTTYGTLLTELALATLVFAKPLRKWVLICGLILHAGIEYRMNIPMFAFTMTATYLVFYEGREVAAWAERLANRYEFFRRLFSRFVPREVATSSG